MQFYYTKKELTQNTVDSNQKQKAICSHITKLNEFKEINYSGYLIKSQ